MDPSEVELPKLDTDPIEAPTGAFQFNRFAKTPSRSTKPTPQTTLRKKKSQKPAKTPYKASANPNKSSAKTPRRCGICKETGHNRSKCPRGKAGAAEDRARQSPTSRPPSSRRRASSYGPLIESPPSQPAFGARIGDIDFEMAQDEEPDAEVGSPSVFKSGYRDRQIPLKSPAPVSALAYSAARQAVGQTHTTEDDASFAKFTSTYKGATSLKPPPKPKKVSEAFVLPSARPSPAVVSEAPTSSAQGGNIFFRFLSPVLSLFASPKSTAFVEFKKAIVAAWPQHEGTPQEPHIDAVIDHLTAPDVGLAVKLFRDGGVSQEHWQASLLQVYKTLSVPTLTQEKLVRAYACICAQADRS